MTQDWLAWPETQALVRAFEAAPLRFVGGCVRDRLLGREVTDVDAATPLVPEETMRLLENAGLKAVPTGIAHGTVTAVIEGRGIEITTLRRDISCDGRHAEVQFTDDWKEDASRRDFTMNALYLTPRGELFDYFDGEADARAGRVRFIGAAAARIAEDYLRILRFFRFHAHYGQGEADKAAIAACAAAAQNIATLSGERIRHEMLKLLAAPRPSSVLAVMPYAVLAQLFPQPFSLRGLRALEEGAFAAPDALPRLALLLRTGPQPKESLRRITERWKFSNAQAQRLRRLVNEELLPPDLPDAQRKSRLRALHREDFADLARISAALTPGHEGAYADMLALAERWQPPAFPVTGADLRARGMPEGPEYGKILRRLEEEWEASGYALGKEALLKKI